MLDIFKQKTEEVITLGILTEGIVFEAIDLALPSIVRICKAHSWGPQGVVIAVGGKGLSKPIVHIMDNGGELGPADKWEELWGEGKNFRKFALEKLQISLREGKPSGQVIGLAPWKLQGGDSTYKGAVAEDTDLAVSASGSYEEIDEMIAWIVWNLIAGLCAMEIRFLKQDGKTMVR